jgi:hypothetical protein
MSIRIYKFICTFLGLLGFAILVGTPVTYFSGALDSLSYAALTLKLSTSGLRAIFLIMCMFVTPTTPRRAARFAWLAFVFYVVGASADGVYLYGVVDAAKNLMLTFYLMTAVHFMAALSLQLLAMRLEGQARNG